MPIPDTDRHVNTAPTVEAAESEIRTELRDFRQATTSSVNAMRDDLAELRSESRTGFTEMRGKFDRTAAGQAQIVDLLSTLIGRQDQGEQ